MKTLLIRPGAEVVEKTLRGPWPPELSHLQNLYKEKAVLFRGLGGLQSISHSSTVAVGSVLRRMGEYVEYMDVPFEFGIPLTEELNVKRNEKVEDHIARGGYDVVAISCISSFESVATQRVAEAAKRASRDITVAVGGYQAVADASAFMKEVSAIDVTVLSDFEPIAGKLYSAFEGKVPLSDVPNLMYRDNGEIKTSEKKYIKVESNELPIYDFSLIEKYLSRYAMFTIEASRGCPYECSYCQEKVLRQSYSAKDPSVAADEFINTANYLLHVVSPVIFLYSDPLWGLNPRWVKDFCSQLAARRHELTSDDVAWIIEARIGQFDDEALLLMKKAGCMSISYGVESLSPRMLTMMQKTKDPEKYIATVFDAAHKTLEHGIQTMLFFLLGMPGETHETIQETLTRMRSLPIEKEDFHIGLSLAHPLSGTLLHEQIHDPQFVKEHGVRILDENDWKKAYIPRLTLLFDPSRDLPASKLAGIYLDLINGNLGIPVFEKQLEMFKEVRTLLGKEEISPEGLERWSRSFRRNAQAHLRNHNS